MKNVEIYTLRYCPYCHRAKALLESKGVQYKELPIDNDPKLKEAMIERADGRRTVPQIFIDGQGIGGCDELYRLESTGELNRLLGID